MAASCKLMCGLLAALIVYPWHAIGAEPAVIDRASSHALTGDLPDIVARRVLRVLVSYSRSNFFVDEGQSRGFEYELLHRYEEFLNQAIDDPKERTSVIFVPVPFAQLMPALEAGRGDVAAAGLTVTANRMERFDFTEPYLKDVHEVFVLSPHLSGVDNVEDLAGRTVHVMPATSFAEHMQKLNQDFMASGLAPMAIQAAHDDLDTEGLLELVNAGIVDVTVADEHVADLWSGLLTNMVVRKDLLLHEGGVIAWMVRKKNPELRESLSAFARTIQQGSLLGNLLFTRYYDNTQWIDNPLSPDDRKRLEERIVLFRHYGRTFDIDWLALAAQAYQESGLKSDAISPAGAVGLMQVRPSTARDPNVDVEDISTDAANLHAGAKYMRYLMDTYYDDPSLTKATRWDFALAAYNMGPTRLHEVREAAKGRGLDPNRWFNHVEYLALERVGREPVRYVGNINKYYIAYRMLYDKLEAREQQMDLIRAGEI